MPSSNERWDSLRKLVGTACSWASSHHYLESALPGPNDDAEMEMKEELLLDAARAFVEAHKGVETLTGRLNAEPAKAPDVDVVREPYQVFLGNPDVRAGFLKMCEEQGWTLEPWVEPPDHDDFPTMMVRVPSDPAEE